MSPLYRIGSKQVLLEFRRRWGLLEGSGLTQEESGLTQAWRGSKDKNEKQDTRGKSEILYSPILPNL